MKQMLKTTTAISATEIVLMVVALIKNKYLAVTIGPEGFGIYGLLLSFFNLAAVFSGSWLATGATKYISEYNSIEDKESVQIVYTLSVGLTTIISIFIVVTFFIANKPIRKVFLSEEVLSTYFLLFTAAFIGNSLRPVFLALLQGLKRIKSVVQCRIIISLFEIATIITLVYILDLVGFFLSIFISSVFSIIIFWYQFYKGHFKISLKLVGFDDVSRKLMKFGGVNLFLALTNLGGQYFQRKIILINFDIVSVGLLHAAVAIRNYSDIIGRGSGFYFLPRMSEKIQNKIRNKEINNYMLFSLIIYILIGTFIILFKEFIITLLLSEEFLMVGSVISWFIIDEYLHNFSRPLTNTIIGMAALKIHAINSIMASFFWILVPLLFCSKIGIKSIALGFIFGSLFSMLNSGIFLIKRIGLIITTRNYLIGLIGFIFIIAISNINIILYYKLILIILLLVVAISILTKNEKTIIVGYFKNLKIIKRK